MSGLKTALAFSTAVVLGTTVHAQSASAEAEVTLRMANWAGTAHHMYHHTLPKWFEEIKKQTDGKVDVIYDKVMLSKAPGLYDLARDGVRDISWSAPSQNPGRFPLARFGEVPFGSPGAVKGSVVFDEWYRKKHKLNEREMSDVKFLFTWQPGPGLIHTKFKIDKMEDLKGVKLRASSGDVIVAESLGAIPVTLGATQAYEAIQRGTVDGTFFPMEGLHSFRLMDLVKFHLKQPAAGLYSGTFYVAMNPKSYDSMPAELRAGFDRAVEKGAEIVGGGWGELDLEVEKEAIEHGNTVYTLEEQEADRWRKTVYGAGTVEQVIERAEKNGHTDAKELMDDLLQMYRAVGS